MEKHPFTPRSSNLYRCVGLVSKPEFELEVENGYNLLAFQRLCLLHKTSSWEEGSGTKCQVMGSVIKSITCRKFRSKAFAGILLQKSQRIYCVNSLGYHVIFERAFAIIILLKTMLSQ